MHPRISAGTAASVLALFLVSAACAVGASPAAFPLPLTEYPTASSATVIEVLAARIKLEPFNLVATGIFLCAIVHTFLTAKFRAWAHHAETAHHKRLSSRPAVAQDVDGDDVPDEVSFLGQILHFLGEVEAVFGIWAIVLMAAIAQFKGWGTVLAYVGHQVVFTEPMFVVVIMALASTRPILLLAERCLRAVAALGRGSSSAWWLAILILAPVLGSFITEPAAMTIGALLLAKQFYRFKPSATLSYATLGLLFVNVSVGGTLTHFAAPPVLMVAGPWGWDMAFMFTHFGWKALVGICAATIVIYILFRKEHAALDASRVARERVDKADEDGRGGLPVPAWITAVHLAFMAFTVFVAHYPALFVGAFLFFLAFAQATGHHQNKIDLRAPLLVGFFLAGLVIHGGLQAWWIEPVLSSLTAIPLFLGATALTAVNDNAAITYLATLVPGFTDALKYAVVAGAVTGGGLTVIANAPNPAGQAILQRFFPDGVSPLRLFVAALLPTAIVGAAFMLL
jgi:Na+/H+ antiporter NhaD/arsenite permease-like protein